MAGGLTAGMQATVMSGMAVPSAAVAADPSQQAAMMAMMAPEVNAMLQQAAGAASAAQILAPTPATNEHA